jgi:ribosome-binding ATPase YchF (GTP1/OBG family)
MSRIATNDKLKDAKRSKNDEFYTILSDVENELKHYKKHFKNKIVFCNCDDPRISNFFHYFSYNFEKLGLKKLITDGIIHFTSFIIVILGYLLDLEHFGNIMFKCF